MSPVSVGSGQHWRTLADDPSSSMLDRTFMRKMLVKLCAWFGPENAKTLQEDGTVYFWTFQEDSTPHKVTLPSSTFLKLLAFLAVLTSRELLSCVQGADMPISICSSEKFRLDRQSSCADTSPKLEVSTPCLRTKRTREDAIPKRKAAFLNPHFPRRSVQIVPAFHWLYWHQVRYFHVPTEQICRLICLRNPNLLERAVPHCSNRMSWKQSAGHR